MLSVLGVPRETVLADYALSDDIVDYKAQLEDSAARNPDYAFLAQLPWEVVEPLLAFDLAYLEAAYEAIASKYGSLDAYIAKELGVVPAMQQPIVKNLTVPA